MNRVQNLSNLADTIFDVCIIGGGATGAGCALDAALRGLSVVLIEKDDFGAHTSSKSTKLIHGGVRYLEQAVKKFDLEQYKMVKKSLLERRILLSIAPHLTRPLGLVTPCYTWFSRVYYGIGLYLYDRLAGKGVLQKSQFLNAAKTLKQLPFLKKKGLRGSILYYDGQLDDARFNLALVSTASQHGAVALNHVSAEQFGYAAGKLTTLTVQDTLNGETHTIRANCFVNATGTFADHIRQKANPAMANRMRVSKGAHIVTKSEHLPILPPQTNIGMLVPKTDDGRVLFILPWQNQWLIGTTDTEDTLNNAPICDDTDAQYLMEYVRRYMEGVSEEHFIQARWAGQRPLLQADPNADTKQLVRDHEVEVDATSGLISILGGKWTTYRLMAKDTIDKVMAQLSKPPASCRTDVTLLDGAPTSAADLPNMPHVSPEIQVHLWAKYGTNAKKIVQNASPDELLPLLPSFPYTRAELRHNCEHEMACTADDVLVRRWGIALLDEDAAEQLREHIAPLLPVA